MQNGVVGECIQLA